MGNIFFSYDEISAAAKCYGEAFYVLDMERFSYNFDQMIKAFRMFYESTYIAYSYKTNYIPELCRIVDRKGGYAEIVSEMELWLAQKIGVKGKNIYYNGPWKKPQYVESLMLQGGHVNIDSFFDFENVKQIALRYKEKKFTIGIRCNVDIGQKEVSRFGLDLGTESLKKCINELDELPNVKVSGLHCHLPFRDLDSFRKRMLYLEKVLKELGIYEWEYISMGGGYMGNISEELRKEFVFAPPSYEDYAAVVAGGMKRLFGDCLVKPKLIIEPGSALVADAMKYVTKVVDIKTVRDREIATLTGSSFQINPSAKSVRRPIEIFHDTNCPYEERESIDMAGYTCIESDYLYKNYSGYLSKGDYVVFNNVGSYSVVMKPPFIMLDGPVIGFDEAGNTYVICKAQKPMDIFGRMLE